MKTLAATAASAVLLTATTSAQIGFQPATSYPAGSQPDATAAGDFDGDGDLDLAVANDAPDKVSILTNMGGGTFSGPTHVFLAGGSSPHTPVAGDLDGDGDVDVAVSLQNTNLVQLLINNGGTFTPGATFAVGAEPRAMAIGDLDGDNDRDLAVVNRNSDSISVLRNMGGLNFSVTSYATGQDPRGIAIGDFTGDSMMDIAVAAHDTRQINLLRNTGAAAFTSHADLSTAPNRPDGVAIDLLDAGGMLDIAASASDNNVEFALVWLNQGGGAFGGFASYPTGGQNSSTLVARDLDVDGDSDLAVVNSDSNDVSVLANSGAGTFGGAMQFGVGSDPGHLIAADLDGNGAADLVTTNNASNDVSVLVNNNAGQACSVMTYCQGKVNSLGTTAAIGSTGTPSVSTGDFVVTVSSAVPGNIGIAFFGTSGPANLPFMNGTLCVQPPTTRLPPMVISGAGTVAYSIPVMGSMVGTQRWYQFWYRDPAHPDGTGVALSDGLAVSFCD